MRSLTLTLWESGKQGAAAAHVTVQGITWGWGGLLGMMKPHPLACSPCRPWLPWTPAYSQVGKVFPCPLPDRPPACMLGAGDRPA